MTKYINLNNHLFKNLIAFNRFFLAIIILCLLLPFKGHTQIDKATETKLNALFENWKDPNQPGVAGGVIQNGKVLFLKGFGSADLAQKTPITVDTKFHIGVLSKQFTVFSILLLEDQGKLSLADDIRKYLPQLPDYGHKISIKDLLSQSSGLHEYWALKEIVGWSPTAIFTQADALKLIATQTELDYIPGTKFSRTSAGTPLLTEIVAKVAGQSFEEFTKTNIFEPLNMKNTEFVADQEQIIPGLAKSYQSAENGPKKRQLTQAIPAISLYTSAADLCLWYENHVNPTIGNPALFKKMESPVTLKDGTVFRPTVGELTYNQTFWHLERGKPMYWSYALEGGYAANIFSFPEYNLTSFVIGNNNQYNGMPAMSMAFVFLEDEFDLPSSIDFSTLETVKLSSEKLNAFEGHYWNEKGAYVRKIYNKNDTLRYARPENGSEGLLVPLNENTFQMVVNSDDINKVRFETKNGIKQMTFTSGISDKIISKEIIPITYMPNELAQFTGTFYCEALNTGYEFSLKENKLTASHALKNDITFESVKTDLFRGSEWYFGSIQYQRDEQQAITGFTVSFDGVSNLKFMKVKKGGAIN